LKIIVAGLILILFIAPVLAATSEAGSFWTEFDITFWQTAPFAIFWGLVIDQQLSTVLSLTGAPHWNTIINFAALVSAGNAYLHAKRVTK